MKKKIVLPWFLNLIRIGSISFFNGNNGREELTAFGFDGGGSLAVEGGRVKSNRWP